MATEETWKLNIGDAPSDDPVADWRRGRSAAAAKRSRGRWRIGMAWAGFLLVCAGLIWLATWIRPPRPGRLILIGAAYETNLLVPDNVAGVGGLKKLAAFADKSTLLKNPSGGITQLRSDIQWEPALERLKEPMIVVAISAQGGRDAAGSYLIPHDGDLRNTERQRIRVSAILDQLAKLPATQRKLLVIDAAFMPGHAALGMLSNDFARGLADLEERIAEIPNLVVICSTRGNELSWTAPEWGSTAFGHFLVEGLNGLADEAETGDGDHRVDALELWKYTRDNVRRWAAINREAEQTPILFPQGPDGERRARGILLAVVNRKYKPEPTPDRPESPEPIRLAWDKWAELRDQVPPPSVYAPERWQRYQAGVIRVEQLVRLGDLDAATLMQNELDRMARELRQDAPLPAPALRQAWSIAETDGPLVVSEPIQQALEKLWSAADDDEAQAVWDDWLKTAKANPAAMPPRRDLIRWVLDRVSQEPTEIERAGKRLRLFREGGTPLPPEAHFALMYSRDGPVNPPAAEFQTTLPYALKVRHLAERVELAAEPKQYSYSERLDPWVGAAWVEVDRSRQYGQDLLFGGSAAEWKAALPLLQKADAGYQKLQTSSADVRRAFAVRDQVQSLLPFYIAWSLKKPLPDAELDAQIASVQLSCHALDAELAKAKPAAPEELAAAAHKLGSDFAALEAKHRDKAQKLREARTVDFVDIRRTLRDVEAVLEVPFAERLDLVARQTRLSREVLNQGQPMEPTPVTLTAEQVAKAWGKRFGEFTLSRIGPVWFERWTKPGGESYSQVRNRIEIFGTEGNWWASSEIAGTQIADRFTKLSEEIRRLTALDPKATLSEARASLQESDRIVRLADAQTPQPASKQGLATPFRHWLTAELLARQTQRTWLDHWFDDNPAAEPYFRAVCRGFQIDVGNLVSSLGSPGSWKQSMAGWDKRLQEPGELALVDVTGAKIDDKGQPIIAADRSVILTSEQSLQRDYRLQPSRPGDVTPGGLPMVWIDALQGLTAIEPKQRQRVVVPVEPEKSKLIDTEPFVARFTSPLIAEAEEKNALRPIQRTSLNLKGLFRGQQIRRETRVEVQPTADVIVRQVPMPNKSSVAVRTRRDNYTKLGSAQGAVVFVLDASGSMRPVDETSFEKSRYAQAVKALEEILRKLPRDTRVSVWTFGQAMGPEKSVDNAEETIVQTIPPMLWDPLNAKQLDAVIAKLNYPSIEPWNESPIARALLKAKRDLADVPGFKTIVAITDGGDNRYEKDEALKAKSKNFAVFLRDEFDKGDVLLNFLSFPPVGLDETRGRRELKTIETVTPAGKVYDIHETDKLIEVLGSMLKQRLNYFVDYQGKNVTVDGTPSEGLDVSPSGQNYRWIGKGLPPGGHKLHVDVNGRVEKSILLHRGDLLLADLVETPTGYTFERFLFSSEFPWKRSLENGNRQWKMSVLQNQLGPRKDLEMLVGLEKTVDRKETLLEQIKPKDVWLEVTPAAGQGPTPPVRWSYLAGYPAPAWAVLSPAWPTDTPAKVQMWWNPDEPARAAADVIVGEIQGDRDRAVFLPGEPPVSIESVRIEKHYVETSPGVLGPRHCLVVRITHAAGRPVIARLQGFDPAGSETRIYSQVDKTASLFWFDPDIDPTGRLPELMASRIRLISIAAFKDEARRRGYWLEIGDLAPPDPSDERPRPPIELR
jgi:hypothetical protein